VNKKSGAAGIGVDYEGGPVIDPTSNVIALNDAANKRQDDLREANNKYLDAEFRRLEQTATLRAEHAKEIGALESNRLNAIRQVDVLAVNTAYDRAAATIQTLAVTTTANAENLRNALNTTAATIAAQWANTVAGITERLAALEMSSYEGKGKQSFADPMMAELVAEMKNLREVRATGAGKIEGISASWGVLLGAVALIATLISIGSFVYAAGHSTAPVAPQPQIVYVPAPPPK
jgi:hypothetical protein